MNFENYVQGLRRLTPHVDPLVATQQTDDIHNAAALLEEYAPHSVQELAYWLRTNPDAIPVVGLAVGLSQEKLKNALVHEFGTSSWRRIARDEPDALAEFFDGGFDALRSLELQLGRSYSFGDVLVARAGPRAVAIRAGAAGRSIEDAIEEVAFDLGLDAETRTRFMGRSGRDAPCDLVIPSSSEPMIVVAAKGFDSTGSKLTDAVREIEEMADVRLPRQFCLAVVDGIGWKSRMNDLRRIYSLLEDRRIDGLYTLNDLSRFRSDVAEFARLRGLLNR
jgi:hypothetical protein